MYWQSISKSVRINYFLIKREGQTLGATAATGVVATFLTQTFAFLPDMKGKKFQNEKTLYSFVKYLPIFLFCWNYIAKEIFKDDCQFRILS